MTGKKRSGGLHAVWAAGCLDRLTRWGSGHSSGSFLCTRGGFDGLRGLTLLMLGLWKVTDREDEFNSLTIGRSSVNVIMVSMVMGLAGSTLNVTVTMSGSFKLPLSVAAGDHASLFSAVGYPENIT